MPRPPTPVGSFGAITHTQRPDGTWSARTYIRDTDGERRLVERRGRSRAAADRALKTALADRTPPSQDNLSASTRVRDLARHGAIPTNPVRDIGRLPGVRRTVKARSLTLAECQRWITQLEADPAAVRRDLPDLTRWLLATGVRIGEAIAMSMNSTAA